MTAAIEPITGRYVTVTLEGIPHRIYFEEAGQGQPLLCLHTAGSDSRHAGRGNLAGGQAGVLPPLKPRRVAANHAGFDKIVQNLCVCGLFCPQIGKNPYSGFCLSCIATH